MADEINTTKVGELGFSAESGADSGVESNEILSLEALDLAIEAEDPEFAASLNSIGPDAPGIVIDDLGLNLSYTLKDELLLWTHGSVLRKRVAKFLPFIPLISYQLKLKRGAFLLGRRRLKEQIVHRVKNAGPLLVKFLKKQLLGLKESLVDSVSSFSKFSVAKKILFVVLMFATGATGYLAYRMGTQGLLPAQEDLFILSLADWADEKITYDPKSIKESFYESTRTSQNILLMKKMVVNLRRPPGSLENPMGAFEFYVEGTAAEVVVEIKDRESEIVDAFMRTIEDMTFEQVSSAEGKRLLCDRLRKEANRILTTGFVRRVFINTAIVKP